MGSRDALIPLHSHGSVHTAYRKLLDPMLAPRAVAYLEPHIRELADSLIDAFADRGHVEFHDEFAVPIAATIFLQLFGLPVTDMEFLNSTKDEILKNHGETPEERARLSVEAGDRLRGYLGEKLDERELESEPRDDLIGRFTTFEVEGRRLDRDEILRIMHLFTIAGLDTVTASLTCIVGWFARHPRELERVVVDPDVLPAAIEELMRYENPVLTSGGRMAVADTEVNGLPVKAGDLVTQCWTTANLDPEVFRRPADGRLRPERQPSHRLRCRVAPLSRITPRPAGVAHRGRPVPPPDPRLHDHAGRDAGVPPCRGPCRDLPPLSSATLRAGRRQAASGHGDVHEACADVLAETLRLRVVARRRRRHPRRECPSTTKLTARRLASS